MSTRLDEIIRKFELADDDELRLELLLDYSRRLPALPQRLHAERDAGLHRVPECMSPVYLRVERDDGAVRIHGDVAEEAPTVKGFLSILVSAFDGAPPGEILEAPRDLLQRLGLTRVIRMTRFIGLTAIQARIRDRVAELEDAPASSCGNGQERPS